MFMDILLKENVVYMDLKLLTYTSTTQLLQIKVPLPSSLPMMDYQLTMLLTTMSLNVMSGFCVSGFARKV